MQRDLDMWQKIAYYTVGCVLFLYLIGTVSALVYWGVRIFFIRGSTVRYLRVRLDPQSTRATSVPPWIGLHHMALHSLGCQLALWRWDTRAQAAIVGRLE